MSAALTDRQLVVTRVVAAPRALVWEAFTDPKHVGHWWGPFGFRITTAEQKMAPGGAWRFTMHGPDGTDYPNLLEYVAMEKPSRLVFRLGTGKPGEVLCDTEITFVEEGARTRVTLTQTWPTVEGAAQARTYAIEGGNQTMTRMEAYVGAMREQVPASVLEGVDPSTDADFVITRVFAAPRELLFRVMTEPEHLGKWFGPAGMAFRVVSSDLRPGGEFRYAMKAGANELFGKFVYREVKAPERVSYVVSFTDANGAPVRHPMSATWPLEVLAVNSLAEHGGKTVFMGRSMPIHCGAVDRETFRGGHAGMVGGFKGTYDNLDAYLATLR